MAYDSATSTSAESLIWTLKPVFPMKKKQPNIVLIMADQLAVSALPFYGHALVQAPNLCQLAANGVVFDSAYCNFPICAPSRFSMLSGRLPHSIAAYDNA